MREEKELRGKLSAVGGPSTSGVASKPSNKGQYESINRDDPKRAPLSQCNSNNVRTDIKDVEMASIAANLQNLTGVKFDMSGFLKNERDSVLPVVEPSGKTGKGSRSKWSKMQDDTDSDSDMEGSTYSSSDDEDMQVLKRKKLKKGKLRSGRYDKLSDTKLVSNEWYAHTALDEALGAEKS